MHAYAASDACFCRRDYILIALAPVVVWGLVLGVLAALLADGGWFWVVWMIRRSTCPERRGPVCHRQAGPMPPNLLVQDAGGVHGGVRPRRGR